MIIRYGKVKVKPVTVSSPTNSPFHESIVSPFQHFNVPFPQCSQAIHTVKNWDLGELVNCALDGLVSTHAEGQMVKWLQRGILKNTPPKMGCTRVDKQLSDL